MEERIKNNDNNKDNSNKDSCSNNNNNNPGRNQEEYDKMKEEMEGRINRLRAEHSEKVMKTFWRKKNTNTFRTILLQLLPSYIA